MEEPFANQLKLASFLGFGRSRTRGWKIMHVIAFLLMGYDLFTVTTFIQWYFTENVFHTAEALSSIVTCTSGMIKMVMLVVNANEIYDLIDDLKDLNRKWKPKDKNSKIEELNRIDLFVYKCMAGSCIFGAISYLLQPLLANLVGTLILGGPLQHIILFKSAFYFDLTYGPFYWFTYLEQSHSCFVGACYHAITDTIFFCVCMNISAHFEIMREIINDIPVKEFAEYHQNVFDLAQKTKSTFNLIIFVVHVIISLSLCVLDVQIVMYEDLSKAIPVVFQGIATVTELLIFSYGGQCVMDSAENVCVNCYDPDKFIVMLRTKRELKIESLIFHASLPTCNLMCSRAMSLVALMKSFL